MRTIIAGSRTATKYSNLLKVLEGVSWKPTVVLSGTARGADRLGEQWAEKNGIEIERYPADWETHGKRAGFIRNAEMVKNAEALIALWDGESRGTKHIIDLATKHGLFVHVWRSGLNG